MVFPNENSSREIEWAPLEDVASLEKTCIEWGIYEGTYCFTYTTRAKLKESFGKNPSITSNKLLKSSNVKYLIVLEDQFFHVIHDFLAIVLKLHKINPSAIFIFYTPSTLAPGVASVYEYLKELFKYKKIKNMFLDMNPETFKSPIIEINNYIEIASYMNTSNARLSLYDYLYVSDIVLDHIGAEKITPYRKVYLSRSHIKRYDEITPEPRPGWYMDDVRLDREYIVEEFFRVNGYEIVIPEQKFSTFREQLEYMASVKVLASVTSAGLTNALFMKNGQHILEIVAELVTGKGKSQAMELRYLVNSYMKNHMHLSIPSRLDPDDAVNRLKSYVEYF